jgi:hypothetical protein
MLNHLLRVLFLIALVSAAHTSIVAQSTEHGLFSRIEGMKYEKRNYDKDGKLIDYQEIEVGVSRKNGDKYKLPVRISSYDENGTLLGKYELTYSCNPGAGNLFAHVVPLADIENTTHVALQQLSKDELYPAALNVNASLPDISLSMDIEGGLRGFIGAKNQIKIYNRKVVSRESMTQTYQITGQVQIRAYVFGIKVSSVNFTTDETFDLAKGVIINQRYTQTSGEYFTITLVKS